MSRWQALGRLLRPLNVNSQNPPMRILFFMKKFFIASLLLFALSSAATAEVSQFVLVTREQTVVPNVLSQVLTVQSQNNTGVSEAVLETTDLIFESTSLSGKFVGAGGKSVSKTMSKNTAHKNFYYIDPTIGTHTLTVTTIGRISKDLFLQASV